MMGRSSEVERKVEALRGAGSIPADPMSTVPEEPFWNEEDDERTNNNMVFRKRRVVFMLIPKAAATSIKAAVAGAVGCAHPIGEGRCEWRSSGYVMVHCGDYLKVAFVRHPVKRLMSCWKDKVAGGSLHRTFESLGITYRLSFQEFVYRVAEIPDERADKHFRGQSFDLIYNGALIPTYVGRIENVRKDWEDAQALLKTRMALPDLTHKNQNQGRMVFNDALRRVIEQRYVDDMENFY